MSDLSTACHTSRGRVGRKLSKARRFALRLARRRGNVPPPGWPVAQFPLHDIAAEHALARDLEAA
jgi:hypothetical protein